ncbi:type I-E CRISPR-associated protein Cse2/CasB [Kutzneria sp. NPDC052558]|uniref:type I-E CRISPR-associated protein Cse2/CasB n=1 Tax=Kutzneria sp. NPDC052558 TaxID=3364121 RepID=UPI0037C94D00
MTTPAVNRRYDFIADLYQLGADLTSPVPRRTPEARRTLAHLRRGLAGDRQHVAAYEYIFRHNPSDNEAETWMLIAGLFALHPKPTKISANTSLGAAMGVLARTRKDSVTRRFTQLLGQNSDALPHYLRQCVQLLAHGEQPVDYRRLLEDVLILTSPEHCGPRAQDLRLLWIREFHRHANPDRPRAGPTPHAAADSEETTK